MPILSFELRFSLLNSEDVWLSHDFPGDRSVLSTFVAGYENTAIAERLGKTQKSSLISMEKV